MSGKGRVFADSEPDHRLGRVAFLTAVSVVMSLIAVAGCWAAPDVPSDIVSGARQLFRLVCGDSVALTDAPVVILPIAGKNPLSKVSDELSERFRAEWGHCLPAESVERTLERLVCSPEDLKSAQRRRLLLSASGARLLVLVKAESDERAVTLSALRAGSSGEATTLDVPVAMTDEIRRYLSLPVPATVRISVPSGATAYLGGTAFGPGGGTMVTRLPAGLYHLEVTKPGYARYSQHLYVTNDERLTVRVGIKSDAVAPLGATLSSMLFPGLANVLYGRPKADRELDPTDAEFGVYLGAVCFYVGAALWLSDEWDPDKDEKLASEKRNDFIRKQHTEMYVAAGGYLLNVVAAYFVGVDYAKKNREMLRITRAESDRGTPSLARAGVDRATGICAGYAWRF